MSSQESFRQIRAGMLKVDKYLLRSRVLNLHMLRYSPLQDFKFAC
jgi:hypothetical protein